MPRRKLRVAIAALVFTGGVLFTAALDDDGLKPANPVAADAALAPVSFAVTLARGQLLMSGATASAEHETALSRLASDQYRHVDLRTEFTPGVLLPGHWETTTSRLLYALAATDSARAAMGRNSIQIRAVTSDAETFRSRLSFLREASDLALTTEVLDIAADTSFAKLCRRAFSELDLGPVSFEESSAELRESSLATLHRLVDYANDCPATRIAITGHSDASGDAAWNKRLSLARAQTIADHLSASGIDPARLTTEGRGSSEPVADNSTAPGRESNRRIEFELR